MKPKNLLPKTIRALFIALLATQTVQIAQAGRWRDFCQRYIFADDPHEGEELIQEARQRFSNESELRQFLRDTYYSEINRPRPRRSITDALEAFFGGKP